MAPTPTRKRRARTAAAATTKPAAAKRTSATRPRADEQTVAARRKVVQQRVIDGGESAATVAKDLGITAGKAAFIAMQLRVENGEVPAISFKNDEQLVSKTVAARAKADEHSSWGWLSARTGVGEATLKAKLEAAGHSVAGEKIASVRKANRPATAKKPTTRKATTTASKSKSTRTRTRRAAADPS